MTSLAPLSAAAVAEGASGRWLGTLPATIAGFGCDSRTLAPDEVFVAVAARRDGHDFLTAAAAARAAGAMVQREQTVSLPQLLVDDTVEALGRLAFWRRCSFDGKVVAISGSAGKTTVRAMLKATLAPQEAAAVLAADRSMNNNLGLPLTLLRLGPAHRWVILEAGMNHPGELTSLGAIAQPDVTVITNAGHAHCGNFASPAAIVRAKGELIEQTAADGVCVLNYDDPGYPLWRHLAGTRRVLGFSVAGQPAAEVRRLPGAQFSYACSDQVYTAPLMVPGQHNEANALAVAATALALAVDQHSVAAALASYQGLPGRLQHGPLAGGGLLIDDSYNASPESVQAGLEVLAARPETRKVLILGDMLELGSAAVRLHEQVGAQARALGIATVLSIGSAAAAAGGRHFSSPAALAGAIRNLAGEDCAMLVKGSRAMRMEQVIALTREEEEG